MKQSSKRLTSVLLTVLLLVGAFIVFFDLIEPAYGDLETAKATQGGQSLFYTQEQATVTQAKTILSEYQNNTTAESSLALAMPSGPDIAGALAQVYGLASGNGIAITNISIQAPTVDLAAIAPTTDANGNPTPTQIVKPLGTISFQISGTGSYEAVKSFLQGIESNIRIFDLTSFSIQPASGGAVFTGKTAGPSGDLFGYSITVVTYYQLQ